MCVYFSDVEAQRAVRALGEMAEAVRELAPVLSQLRVVLETTAKQVPDADV